MVRRSIAICSCAWGWSPIWTRTGKAVAEQDAGDEMYLVVEPDSAGYVVLGPTLRLLEAVHPRLPVTFFDLFTHALNRWVRVYDYRDAAERVQQLREWYEGDPEGETVELPDVDGATPKCLRGKWNPLKERSVEQLLGTVRNRRIRALLEGVLELSAAFAERGETRDHRVSPGAVDGFEPAGAGLARSL